MTDSSLLASEPAVLFFDVDGTLIWSDKEQLKEGRNPREVLPNASVYDAFERLHERGHLTFLCTGRPLSFVSEGLLSLGFTGVVSGAGACVTIGDDIAYEAVIPQDILCETIEQFIAFDVTVLLESRQTPVMLNPSGAPVSAFSDIPVAADLAGVKRLAPDMRFCKFSVMPEEDWDVPALREFLDQHFVSCDMGLTYELSMIGVDKGAGVRRALSLLGHSVENTYAFGDSENDLPMFPEVEIPIAMGNAMACVKKQAAYITGYANADGIASALRHFGLI